MSRLRIVCKGEPVAARVEGDRQYPMINGRCASWSDLELTIVDADGESKPIVNVTRVQWIAEQGCEPARAIVDFIDVDVDVEVDLAPLELLEQAVIDWAESKSPAFGPNATERLAELADRLIARKRGAT